MEHLGIILPASLVGIGFLLKLAVNQSWKDFPFIIQKLCELPVDMIFLALSFAVGFTISNSNNSASGLFYCFLGLAAAILIVYFQKICTDLFESENNWWILILVGNLLISGGALSQSIVVIIDDSPIQTELLEEESSLDMNENKLEGKKLWTLLQ